MGRLVLALGLVLAISAATGAAQSLPIVKTIFKTSGNVSGIGIEDRDDPVFRLWGALSIFSVHRPSPAKKAQLAGVLRTAMESHRAVQVTYDAASGRVDKQTESIVYSLCSVALDEMVFQPRRPCIDANRTMGTSHSQALALAVAQAEDGDATVARDQLSRIMLGTGLTHAERTIALEARAIALTRIGNSAKSIGVESDAAFLAALADSRSLVALRPDDEQAAANVAQLLIYLGDYDGAIKAIQSMIRRWPQDREKFEISMAVAARQKGDLEESLRFLDDVVANHRHGMRFFYHRGRTLSMMGRYAEAVASFAKGIKTQADYPWAFIWRGCAYAALGQLQLARDDFDRGINLVDRFPPEPATPAAIERRRKWVELQALLAAELGKGSSIPLTKLCDTLPEVGEQRRPKSPLLN